MESVEIVYCPVQNVVCPPQKTVLWTPMLFRHPSVIPDERNSDTEMRYVTYVGLRCKLFFEMCSAVVGTKLGGYLRLSVSSLVRSVNIVGIQGSFVIQDR